MVQTENNKKVVVDLNVKIAIVKINIKGLSTPNKSKDCLKAYF